VYHNVLDNFVVGLTNIDPATLAPIYNTSYTQCGQHDGKLFAHTTATVDCRRSTLKFRHVVIHGSHSTEQALCLAEVAVYARRALVGGVALRLFLFIYYATKAAQNTIIQNT